ncbi:MAG: dual specificity protein phosphatase family protein [Deltaproteobacteria bacterium]|nr:dual specificity protein phosphatase family protein [Deltaproteobacteria bacterium]
MSYTLTWITSQLAVGSAPMSYEDLDVIKGQGIDAIVNLCGEFCDLYQIEEQSGFEVYYLPIPDECAPDMELMEEALQWLDEALYLKKKILVHCRHGLGRTGTFVSAYLLRRGLGLKLTEKRLKPARVTPGNYSQWQLLRKYGKKQGQLSARPPSIEDKETVDLRPFLREYAAILQEAEALALAAGIGSSELDTDTCCHAYFEMELIEAVNISHTLNRQLNREQRLAAMGRAGETSCLIKKVQQTEGGSAEKAAGRIAATQTLSCPLLVNRACLLHTNRPLRCRSGLDLTAQNRLQEAIQSSSRNVFLALTGEFPPATGLRFSNFDTVSGRFVQQYFQAMIKDTQE